MTTLEKPNPYESPRAAASEPADVPFAKGSHGLSALALSGMVVLAALAMVGTLPGRTHGLGLITEGLLADLALEKPQFAQLNLVATLLGALFCWPCGWLLDRVGMRMTSATVLVCLGISTLGVAMTSSVPMLWLWITLTRGFGQSMLSVVSITLIGKASAGPRQPYAMAIYALLVSVFFIVAFIVMGAVIPSLGWRAAWQGLGWIVLLSGPLFGLLLVEPRGGKSAALDKSNVDGSGDPSYDLVSSATVFQALTSPAFWVFALTSAVFALVSSGLSLFNQSILAERHFEAQVFYTLLSVSTFAGLVSNLAAGWLARSVSYGRLMAAAMTLYTLSLFAFPLVTELWQVYAYGVAIGLCGGVVTVIFFGVWSHAYGRDHLGKIQGIAQASTVLASALGPIAFAECLRYFGSYSPAFWMLAPCVGILALMAWIIPTPQAIAGRWSKREQ